MRTHTAAQRRSWCTTAGEPLVARTASPLPSGQCTGLFACVSTSLQVIWPPHIRGMKCPRLVTAQDTIDVSNNPVGRGKQAQCFHFVSTKTICQNIAVTWLMVNTNFNTQSHCWGSQGLQKSDKRAGGSRACVDSSLSRGCCRMTV